MAGSKNPTPADKKNKKLGRLAEALLSEILLFRICLVMREVDSLPPERTVRGK